MENITKAQGDQIISLLGQILAALNTAKEGGGFAVGGTEPGWGNLTGWKAVKLPSWAKFQAGTPIGLLSQKSLDYWLNWQPRPWQKDDGTEVPPKQADLDLRKALDEARAAIKSGAHVCPDRNPPDRGGSGSPPPRRSSAPRPQREAPAAESADSDVPF